MRASRTGEVVVESAEHLYYGLVRRLGWLLGSVGVLIAASAVGVDAQDSEPSPRESDVQNASVEEHHARNRATRQVDPSTAAFTSVERARLRNGELVTREVTRSEGRYHYIGGTSWQLVRAPIAEVWETVLDTSVYHRIVPSLARARVVHASEDQRIVQMTHRYSIASAEYYARVNIDRDAHRVNFDLDRSRPHDLRDGRGFISLSEYREDTIVTWGALADLGSGMIMQIFGPMLHDWILRVPRCVRDEIEPGHRNIC